MTVMAAFVLVLLGAAPDFVLVEAVDGIRVESRAVTDSAYGELRLTTTSPASVAALCDTAFGDGTIPPGDPNVRERRVLALIGPDERVTYERVTAAIVTDRDYALRVRRERLGASCVVRFELAPERVPPPTRAAVRLTRLSGSWRFVATTWGVTEVTYVTHSEPGGDIPAFLAEGPRRRTELEVVRRTLERARARHR
jgi:hypothetical protein